MAFGNRLWLQSHASVQGQQYTCDVQGLTQRVSSNSSCLPEAENKRAWFHCVSQLSEMDTARWKVLYTPDTRTKDAHMSHTQEVKRQRLHAWLDPPSLTTCVVLPPATHSEPAPH